MIEKSGELAFVADEDLMREYGGGDQRAFEVLYGRHKDRLYRFYVQSTGSEPVARELFQDVWMRVINHRSTYTPKATFTTWLYRIARNRLTDHYRQQATRGVQQSIDDSEDELHNNDVIVLSTPLQPDELAVIAQQGENVQQALSTLSASQREAVLLRHIVGMSLNEVAAATDENPETVKSRLRYAFTRLRQQLRAHQ